MISKFATPLGPSTPLIECTIFFKKCFVIHFIIIITYYGIVNKTWSMTNDHYGLYGQNVVIITRFCLKDRKTRSNSQTYHVQNTIGIDKIISMYNLQQQIYQMTNTSLTLHII